MKTKALVYLAKLMSMALLVVLSVLLTNPLCAMQPAFTHPPTAVKGVLDLRDWNFKEQGTVPLIGEWEFYWQRQLQSEKQDANPEHPVPEYITLPGLWNGNVYQGVELDGAGYVTYRLLVRLPPTDSLMGIKLMDINTAGRIFANGKLLAESGIAGTSEATTLPFLKPQVAEFNVAGDTLELIVHVSNFHDRIGGIRQPIVLGTANQVVDGRNRSLAFEFLLFGSIFIMALYHLGLYLLRRKGTSALYFSIFCFIIALRTILTGERYLMSLAPSFNWQIAVRIEILCFYLAVPAFALFVSAVFPLKFSTKVLRIVQVSSLLASTVIVLLPVKYGTIILPGYQLFTLVVILYVIYIIVLSIRNKQEGAIVFALGFSILFLTTVNDILYDLKLLNTGFWVPFGVFIFIFSQAFLLSVRFSKAFQRVEVLSEELGTKSEELSKKNVELQQHKDTLEQKVVERTESIKILLDNTGQGFLTFRADYRIEPLYSKACQVFFSDPIEDRSALDLLSTSSSTMTDAAGIKEMLDMVFDGVSSIELFHEILPCELKVNGRILKTDYRMIAPAGTETRYRVMVILTDITRERELSEQLRQDEERKEIIVKIAIDKAGFIEFINEMNGLFRSLRQVLEAEPRDIDLHALFRYIHTIKGGSGSYALSPVSFLAHTFEAELDGFRNGTKQLETDSLSLLRSKADQLERVFRETLDSFKDVLSTDELNTKERVYQLSTTKIDRLQSLLQQLVPEDRKFLLNRKLERIYRQPIAPILRRYQRTAEDLAVKLSKTLNVTLYGTEVEISLTRFDRLLGNLVHLVRNCVDHGLEEPDIRLMTGKPMAGQLEIRVCEQEQQLIIVIADDGNGIDREQIKQVAVAKNLLSETEASQLSEDEALALIFRPGFSTAETVSDISGRGVGMDAVQFVVTELGGSIGVQTEIGQGTTFTITVPV